MSTKEEDLSMQSWVVGEDRDGEDGHDPDTDPSGDDTEETGGGEDNPGGEDGKG